MSEENTEKMNFFKRIITSIKDFDKYQIFALEKTSTAVKYLALLMLIFSIVITATFVYQFKSSLDSAEKYFNDHIYEITYEDNNLSINEGNEIICLTNNEILPIVIISTTADEAKENELKDEVNKYESGIILLNDKVIYKNTMLTQDIEYSYEEILANYGITAFGKQDVANFINEIDTFTIYYTLFMVGFIYIFIVYFTSAILDAVLLGFLGFVIARAIGVRIKFKASFNMGIYALTLPILLNLIYMVINTFTGLYIRYFQWMYATISYIYIIVAILIIKTDLINTQKELMKIIQEQEKVKKELQEQERKKQEEKNKEPKDSKEPKEKKKNKQEDDEGVSDNGLAPQG